MNETPKIKSGWRILRRLLIVTAILATLVAIFYTEENWRGKRAWENYKRELEAKGMVLDWNKYIPPPVLDDQNFFRAPKMTEWFVKTTNSFLISYTNEFRALYRNTNIMVPITNQTQAADYLVWSKPFESDFDLIREALKRPYARIDGNYTVPYEISMPSFVASRALAQVLAQRTKCQLLLGQPEQALREITLLNDSRKWLEAAPTSKLMTLSTAMVNGAIVGLYVEAFVDGLRRNCWQERQLAAIQAQLQKINTVPFVFEAFREEQAHTVYLGERAGLRRDFRKVMTGELFGCGQRKTFLEKLKSHSYDLMPQGWAYQNTVVATELHQRMIDTFDPTEKQVFPKKLEKNFQDVRAKLEHHSIFHLLADIAIPNYPKAIQTLAYNQTLANQAQIVCALERFRLAQGVYPETLDALVPQFMAKIPHDLIGGEPLHYRRTDDPPSQSSGAAGGKFVLYSVGWNETDDGGITVKDKSGHVDKTQGDWVWQYPQN